MNTEAEGVLEEKAHSTAIVRAAPAGLSMMMSPSQALRKLKELQAFVSKVMVAGEDYGKIPGIEKATLLQPGAQKLAEIYGLYPTWTWVEVVKDWETPFFYFESKCVLRRRGDDAPVGEGLGSCNSRESKYAGRWVTPTEVPPHLDKDRLERRDGFAWVFRKDIPAGIDPSSLEKRDLVSKRTGNPYSQWRVATPTYLIPNADICSQINTLQKMAAKRALVMAVIGATRSSGIFTQDVEDMPQGSVKPDEEARGEQFDHAKSVEAQQPKKPKGKAAVELAHPERRLEHLQKFRAYLEGARDIEDLKAIWAQVSAAAREGFLDRDQRGELDAIKEARKKALEASVASVPNTTTDGNDAWGVGPEDNEKAREREPGQEG